MALDGLLWTAGDAPPGRALVTAADRILVSEEPGPIFHLNVDLARSNLQRTAAWPVLLGNLVAMRRAALPGFSRSSAALGETLTLATDAVGTWRLVGGSRNTLLRAGSLPFVATTPGLWSLEHDGAVVSRLSVNAIDEAESDLRTRSTFRRDGSGSAAFAADPESDRATTPLVVLLLLLLADFAFAAPGLRR